jgi:hypothetical protein
MAQTIQIKRSSSTSAPGSLLEGEFAWVDHGTGGAAGKLYIGDAAAGTIIDISGSTYAKLVSPSFTGSATAPTQSLGNNSTRIATTAYVDAAILTEDTVLEMGDTDIRDIVASSYSAESQVDINASGISEFAVSGEADDDVDFTTESNYIQQEWTNSNQSTSQATVSGTTVTLSSGTWPTNCDFGRISFDDGSTFTDIESRDSGTQITLSSGPGNGTSDYKLRMSEFISGQVNLNSISTALTYGTDVTSPSTSVTVVGTAHGGTAAGAVSNSNSSTWVHNSATPWLLVDFGSGVTKRIQKYTLVGRHQASNPSGTDTMNSWRLEGSNNNSSWTTVDTRTGVTSWANLTVVDFTSMTGTVGDYRYYRFNITANNGGPNCGIVELELMEATGGSSVPISNYVSVVTSESHNPNTDGWLDLNSASITDTTDSNSTAHYWLGFDPASSYGAGTEAKIFHQDDSVWRTIAKNNSGTWEYNSSVPTAGSTATDETTPSTSVTVVGTAHGGTAAGAVSNSNSSTWVHNSATPWLVIDFGSGVTKRIEKYTIIGRHQASNPSGTDTMKAWRLEGSNNNSSWTTVDTRTGVTSWANLTTVEFTSMTGTVGDYRYYRIFITANNGGPNCGIVELELMEADTSEVLGDAYTGTSATINDMLHAVSQAVSTVSDNRMTEAQTEAITDAEFEATGGFTAGTTSSLFRGTTLYTTDDESNPSVDQYSLNFTGELGDNMFGRVDANQSIGQIFQSTSDDELHSAKMFIKTVGSPTDNVVLKLYSVTGSVGSELPNALLATSDVVAASAMSSSYAEHTFTFSTTVNMVDGTKYAMVCDRSGSDSNTNYYRTQGQDTDVYNSGHLVELDSSTWTTTVLKDLALQVYGNAIQLVGSGRILIYDGTDSWDDKDVSGDITMTKEGVTSLTSASIVDVDISVSAAIANAKLANSTISGKALGANLDSLTLGAGFGAGTYNGSTAVTANVDGILEDLDTLGAAASDGQFIVATGTGAFAYESGATARTSLGLGSSDTPTFTGMNASSTAITNVGLPLNAQEVATLAYVSSVEYGMDFKDSVRAATTADMSATYANGTAGVGATLTGSAALGTIDGITIVAGDRLLIKNQSTAAENGIYVATTITDPFVLTRSVDADAASEFNAGAFTFVEEGTISADNAYINIADDDITFGTTSINWQAFTGAGMITAGTGLSKSGNTLSIDTSYVGQASITTLGTIATGTWESTRVGATYGGTGINTSSSTGIPQVVGGTWTVPSTVAPVYGGLGIDTSSSTGVGSVSSGTWSISATLANTLGGTGTDSSSSTGIPQVVGGTWTYPSAVLPVYGGTGIDTSSSTGVVSVSGGTWSVGTSVPVTQGGSGNTSMTTGDMMMASDTEEMTMLAAGSAGTIMQTSDAIMPTWDGIDGQLMSSIMDSVSITSSGVNTKIGTAGDSPEKVGQTITTTDTGTLNLAKFKLKRIGNPSDTYVAKVAAVSGGEVGSILATSVARSASDVSRAYQMIEFTFSGANKITLANATKYAFYLERTGTADTSNILATDTRSSSSYVGGDAISHDGTSWTTHTDKEHNLQVWTDN